MADEEKKNEMGEEATIEFSYKGAKKKINPKKTMYGFNIGFMLCLIGIMTVCNLIIDPEHFEVWSWLTKTLILVGIEIPSIILGELMSKDRQMEQDGGLYQIALKRINDNLKSIKETKIYFSQFFFWLKQKETFKKKVDYLMSHEFDGLEAVYVVKYIKQEDISPIQKGSIKKTDKDGKEIIIHSIPTSRIQYVINTLNGALDIVENSYSYYLSAQSDKGSKASILEEGPHVEKTRAHNRTFSRGMKVGTGVVFSAIASMIIVESMSDPGNMQTWMNLATRLIAMTSGLISGWLTSITDVKMAARELNIKSDVLEMFQTDLKEKIFIPKSYEELAKEQADDEARIEEEAKKAVVIPDIVIPNNGVKLITEGGK